MGHHLITVVKELRSKMFGQHPGYFKAVFLKQTRIIIVSIFKYTVYIMFWIMMFMIVIIINFIFCPNIIYFCSVKLDFSISYKESGFKIITINWNIAISCIKPGFFINDTTGFYTCLHFDQTGFHKHLSTSCFMV
jgi:hypothetical protein